MSILIDKEITDVTNKITSLKQSCDANVNKDLQGEELTKHVNEIESLIFNEEKVKQLHFKKLYSNATDSLVVRINTETKFQVVGRFEPTSDGDWKFVNGYSREYLIVAPKNNLTDYHDYFVCKLYDHLSKDPMVKSNSGGWILCSFLDSDDNPYRWRN